MPEKDDAVVTLLAGWLLVHELADDWIRDAVSRGRAPEADPLAALASQVDDKKARMKEALATDIGGAEAPGAVAELKESLETLGRRLESIEARLDGLSERK